MRSAYDSTKVPLRDCNWRGCKSARLPAWLATPNPAEPIQSAERVRQFKKDHNIS
jgi:hypothetical protein